ncbi:MAG: hypothetical protein ACHQF2_07620, partial [Flavobacteriales bacterium]
VKTVFMKKRILVLVTALYSLCSGAQTNNYQADTDSINHICDASLEIISVQRGEPVNWERFTNLFLKDGVLIWTGQREDTCRASVITLEKMKKDTGYERHGFKEKPLKRIIHQFGQVACVFESYEAQDREGKYKSRGVNIYQLVYKEGRWWIASISWCDETEKLKLPTEMEK